MKVLIVAIGSAGDVHPFVGVGKALTQRGHQVSIFASPVFEDTVLKAGLGFVPLGTRDDYTRAMENPDLWHPIRSVEALIGHVEPSYETILDGVADLKVEGDTVLVGSSLALGARLARDIHNIPMASVHLAPSLFLSAERPPKLVGAPLPDWLPAVGARLVYEVAYRVTDRFAGPRINAIRKKHGLPPVKRVMGQWWNSPDRVLGLFPPWFASPQSDWPKQTRLTGFPLFDESGQREVPSELQSFLSGGEPPIVFTPGSSMFFAKEFFEESIEVCDRLGKRGLFLTPFERNLPERIPDSILHLPYVPLSQVLPEAAALVYHGGIGTCSQALRAGVPHLIEYHAHDQLDNLSRIQELGVGQGLAARKYRAPVVSKMLGELMKDREVLERCDQVASRFHSQNWLDETSSCIEDLLRETTSR